ncbi:hypothetical protein RJ639_003559 [Escallonia herrerae]|uniref:Bidirectional sugar transporter SWEET n=1 Tax=Escallonia herrerae TaxID=1293975 RepID=A0AA88VZC3_9ASTE|nr:hypothetical protein RJ639_003559 [Escallonia herrerae]
MVAHADTIRTVIGIIDLISSVVQDITDRELDVDEFLRALTTDSLLFHTGNVISFALFASPIPTMVGVVKKKSVEEFQPYPYLATVMNCLFWIFYGTPIVHPHSTLVVTINAIGLVMELCYLSLFLLYPNKDAKSKTKYPRVRNYNLCVCNHASCFDKKKIKRSRESLITYEAVKLLATLLTELVVYVIVIVSVLKTCHTHPKRSEIVGVICIVFGLIMYGSPCLVMVRLLETRCTDYKVIATRSVEFMPFWLSAASFSNGLIWMVYALLRFDLYILIANGGGALLGACQLILYLCYRNATPKPKGGKELELPVSQPSN